MNRPHKVFLLVVIPMCLVLGACDSGKKEKQTTNSLDKTIEVATASAIAAPASKVPADDRTLHAGLFQKTGELMAPRFLHTATLLANGKVLLAGGGAELGLKSGGQNSAEIYDFADGRFSAVGKLTQGRYRHTATLLESGCVLIAGGFGSGPARIVDRLQERSTVAEAELFVPLTGMFNSSGELVVPRALHTATLLKKRHGAGGWRAEQRGSS